MALEARVACPVCGGWIHPVAGRCKHCKEDLSASRGARPPAQTPLPPLAGAAAAAAALAPTYISPVPVAVGRDGSAPILPPRPTGSRPVEAAPAESALRSWPIVVIGLAAAAIVAAVAIMVWPASKPSRAPSPAPGVKPPPAPDHMDSDPLPKSDPWQGHADPPPQQMPQQHADDLPAPQPQRHAGAVPAPKHDDDDDDDGDDNGANDAPLLHALGSPTGAPDMMLAVMIHACARVTACGDTDESARDMCQMVGKYAGSLKIPQCRAAKQCLEQVDKLDCGKDASPASLMSTIPSCFAAATSC